jgi:hypothetical protein
MYSPFGRVAVRDQLRSVIGPPDNREDRCHIAANPGRGLVLYSIPTGLAAGAILPSITAAPWTAYTSQLLIRGAVLDTCCGHGRNCGRPTSLMVSLRKTYLSTRPAIRPARFRLQAQQNGDSAPTLRRSVRRAPTGTYSSAVSKTVTPSLTSACSDSRSDLNPYFAALAPVNHCVRTN